MFQRFHEVKSPQDPELVQGGNESRSSTPGIVMDGRTVFQAHTPLTQQQQGSVVSYPSISSPSLVLPRGTQLMVTESIVPSNKYLNGPPDAHRYMSDAYRLTTEALEQSRYSLELNRTSNDVYRQSPTESINLALDIPRTRVEDNIVEVYHRNNEEMYNNPVDLQRVPDSLQHISTNQRMESDIQRLQQSDSLCQANDLRSVPVSEDLQRHDISDSTSPPDAATLTYRTVITEPMRPPSEPTNEPPTRIFQDSLRPSGDLQRMVQESFGREYFIPHRQPSESLRTTPDLRASTETIHYVTHDAIHSIDPQRYETEIIPQRGLLVENIRIEEGHNVISENLRVGAQTPHTVVPENLTVTPDASTMVPENLCLTDPNHQVLPENLHISHESLVNGHSNVVCNGELSNSHMLSNPQSSEPMQIVRTHYETSGHRPVSEAAHQIRNVMRIQSPHYSENVYRPDLHVSLPPSAPPTPSPSVQPMVDPNGTRYYTTSYISHTEPSSHISVLQNNHHMITYTGELGDDRGIRDGMSLEDRIERGYQDIKPFDQEYPSSMPVMHLTQESMQPSTVSKPPKPKKPKEPKPPRVPVIHKCGECSRVFKNSTQLKNHMWHHTGEKPFTCDECGSKFTQQGNLRAHRRIHTGERPYRCQECTACFTQLSTLKTHQKIHSDERPYKCDRCDAAFRQIANLKTHLVTHTGERPHKCDQCDKAFTQKSNLKAHKNRVHAREGISLPSRRGRRKALTAIRPFTCIDCGAKFTIFNNLKIHMKIHQSDKSFECDYCGAGFTQRANLKNHIQRMHTTKESIQGRRRIRCDECPAMFRLRRSLKAHKKKRHPIKSLKIKILNSRFLTANGDDVPTDTIESDDDGDGVESDESDDTNQDVKLEESNEFQLQNNMSENSDNKRGGNSITEPIINICVPKEEPCDMPPSPSEPALISHFNYPTVKPSQEESIGGIILKKEINKTESNYSTPTINQEIKEETKFQAIDISCISQSGNEANDLNSMSVTSETS